MDKPLQILIVEDCPDTAASTAKLLELWHFDTAIASDGKAALKKVQDFVPDIILLDIGLPDIDGLEVARRFRALTALDESMIVVLSGYGMQSDHEQSLRAGCQLHLVKPVDLPAVRTTLLDRLHEFRNHLARSTAHSSSSL